MNLHTLAVVLIATAAMVPLSAAIAQTPPRAPDSAAVAQPDPPKKPMTRKEARAAQENADARLCLEFPTQLMIVKCAEKYRPDKREH